MDSPDELRRLVESLAALDRGSCSPGEEAAARWIARKLKAAGAHVLVERERVHGTYWWPLGLACAGGIAAAALRRRLAGGVLGAVATAAAVDDLSAGRRRVRAVLPKQTTTNVVAVAGDPAARRTLMLVAHHDAAHTGVVFHPRLATLTGRPFPPPAGVVREQAVMLPIVLAPALSGLGAALGARRLALLGGAVCAMIGGLLVEASQRSTVPGANDNLSGVAVLIAIARQLQRRPIPGIRVVLVSTGAEESLMEGMRAYGLRHFGEFDRGRTHVLCLDVVGSRHLVLPMGEGMLRARPYDADFAGMIDSCARDLGIAVHRGLRLRLGTDCYVAMRYGFPAATLTSLDERGRMANYHWSGDTPDRVNYDRLGDAARLCEAVIARLAAGRSPRFAGTPTN